MVWLDLPRATVMRQVIGRTVRRRLNRQRLWNDNLEAPLWTILTDREHIIRWAWDTHEATADRVRSLLLEKPALPVVRVNSHAESRGWIEGPLTNSLRVRHAD